MKHRHAATAYANALFAAAKEWNQTEIVSRELDELGETFVESNPELREAFARPWVPPAARRALWLPSSPGDRTSPRKRRRKRKRDEVEIEG